MNTALIKVSNSTNLHKTTFNKFSCQKKKNSYKMAIIEKGFTLVSEPLKKIRTTFCHHARERSSLCLNI
jgi:hypothetical protein